MSHSRNSKLTYFIICIIITSLLDYFISNFIVNNINSSHIQNYSQILELTYIENTGAAFSILQNNIIFLIIFAILASLTILTILFKNINKATYFDCFFFAMLISGITCNTYERLLFGYVRDFFNIKLFNFPIFNISDILINISVLVIMARIIQYKKKQTYNE